MKELLSVQCDDSVKSVDAKNGTLLGNTAVAPNTLDGVNVSVDSKLPDSLKWFD